METSPAKVALVTGGARRIGAAIAEMLHQQGFDLLLHYRSSRDAAEKLQLRLQQSRPASIQLLRGDLRRVSEAHQLLDEAEKIWGRLDVLVNNASAFYPTPLGEVTESHWDELLDSNLKAPFFLSQAAFPLLQKSQGCIVNIVDIYARRPRLDYPVYSVAKAGLAAMTHALAKEMAPRVRVNGVAPGAILWPDRPLTAEEKAAMLRSIPLQRLGGPQDIAKAVRYLVCEGDYVTGQILVVDGGRSL